MKIVSFHLLLMQDLQALISVLNGLLNPVEIVLEFLSLPYLKNLNACM